MPIKPIHYAISANNQIFIEDLIRKDAEQFKSDLEKVNAANTLVRLSKSSIKRKRSSGKPVKKKSKRRKILRVRK